MLKRLEQSIKLKKTKLVDDEWYDIDGNGRGIIDVGAENYDDIFSYYDLDGENVLDREFDEFLEAKADAIPLGTELTLHFHVKNASEQKRDEIDRAVKNNYKRELRAINRKIKRNTIFSLYMLIMGIIAFGVWITLVLFNVHFAVVELFNIVAWVFVWEAVNSFFLTRQNLKIERLKKYRFVRSDICVYEYRTKKRKTKFGKNTKLLNNYLNQVEKDNKNLEKQIIKVEQTQEQSIKEEKHGS